jgi:hypothetical protein
MNRFVAPRTMRNRSRIDRLRDHHEPELAGHERIDRPDLRNGPQDAGPRDHDERERGPAGEAFCRSRLLVADLASQRQQERGEAADPEADADHVQPLRRDVGRGRRSGCGVTGHDVDRHRRRGADRRDPEQGPAPRRPERGRDHDHARDRARDESREAGDADGGSGEGPDIGAGVVPLQRDDPERARRRRDPPAQPQAQQVR